MKVKSLIFLTIFSLSSLISHLSSALLVHAAEPFPPFSVEGNPPEEYYFDQIFPLFTFIRPSYFQVFENEDYSRDYQALQVCSGSGHDRRDPYCNDAGDKCTGGDVDICYKGLRWREVAHTAHSNSGSCNLNPPDPERPYALREGTCEYTKNTTLKRDVKGTDFSASTTDLTYPKLQNEAGRYSNLGSPDNPITYGSHFLALNQCDRGMRQLLVVARAKQTKVTLRQTGEWPLGWVDWGYTTANGTTLIGIYNSLPSSVSGNAKVIIEGIDDYYLNTAGYDIMSNISKPKQDFCNTFSTAITNNKKWAIDLAQAPIYSPSFRQGYTRASICRWNVCCPGDDECPPNPLGISKSLFYNISISQAFGGALDDLLFCYPLEEGAKIFRRAATNNQLIRFLTSASTQAIPSTVATRLNKDLEGNNCFDRRPNLFRWLSFGMIYDHLNDWEFLDPDEKCPGYRLQPELTKEKGGAYVTQSPISRIIDMIWKKFDDVDPTKHHLISVPDAMGQSISELQGHIYNTRDNLAELEKQLEYNQSLSNTVDDSADGLLIGMYGHIASALRHTSLFPCSSGEYSNYTTSIEAYAFGARSNCLGTNDTSSANLCDPTAFEKLIADSPWQAPLPEAVNTILNSEMFINGKFNPELEKVYAQAAKETGLPCEVLAGLHFEEGSEYFTDVGGPEKVSVTSGNPLEPGQSLLDTALIAGSAFLSRHVPTNTSTLITAISNFNGGGNSNCQLGYEVKGVPTEIPYSGCPRSFQGDDDPYATNMLDPRHTNMWLLFHSDNEPGIPTPYGTDRPGAFAVALTVYNEATSKNTVSSDDDPNDPNSTTTPSGGITPFTPKKCGPNSLDTALGCISYGDNLTSTLLTFLIGISGLISLAVMLTGTVQIMTASGDIEKSRKGRELFTAAIVGLFFIIFSVTLLRTFAGEIIKLPGF